MIRKLFPDPIGTLLSLLWLLGSLTAICLLSAVAQADTAHAVTSAQVSPG